MKNSRAIDDLRPGTAEKCRRFIEECDKAGIDVIITSTLRDTESQNALYAQGRTAPGAKVTNVKGGHSFHNYGVAFDFVPVVNGKAVWDDGDLWTRCGYIGEQCGLEWGGSWDSFVDKPHMQDTGGFTIAQYLAGESITA
jgi:peptidoglycan LD-endopeptidase CwlK